MESSPSIISEDSKVATDCDKERKLRFRSKVLDEIVSSEESYIAQLDLLLNVYRCCFNYVS